MSNESVYLPGKIRDRIQDLMKSHKVTQAELATRIDCSESALSRFISGKTDKLGDENIIRIARVFNVSTDFLLGEVDIPDRLNYDISELGLSVQATRNLYTHKVNPQVVNALEPLFLPVIQAVVFLSVWIVVRVLCRMLGRVLRGINAIPLIGGLNRILGFAFGFVSGLLNCWFWSILLWVAANLTGGKLEFLTTATLNRSVIYGLLANLNPFLTRY